MKNVERGGRGGGGGDKASRPDGGNMSAMPCL